MKHLVEDLFNASHSDCISTCCCGDVGRTVFCHCLIPLQMDTYRRVPLIDEFLNFFMYNAINYGVDVACCSGCWLINEVIFFLLGS